MVTLVRPTPAMKEAVLAYRQAHFDHGEMSIDGGERLCRTPRYEDWLARVTANADPATVDPSWVLTDTFLALDDADEIVGVIDLRHELKGDLVDYGHCGYSVRPDRRRRGYAAEMLRQVLEVARGAGMTEVTLAAERDNIASVRTIVKCGGQLVRSFDYGGQIADVYRIAL